MRDMSIADPPSDSIERRPHEPVARRVEGELLEPARDRTAAQEVPCEGLKDVDATSYPRKDGTALLIAAAQVASHTPIDRVG